jgi:hypothetical protein
MLLGEPLCVELLQLTAFAKCVSAFGIINIAVIAIITPKANFRLFSK